MNEDDKDWILYLATIAAIQQQEKRQSFSPRRQRINKLLWQIPAILIVAYLIIMAGIINYDKFYK